MPFFSKANQDQVYSVPQEYATEKSKEDEIKEYDYVIVGGGTSGCVLANRLSEDPNFSVLLIEAGGPDDQVPFSRVPGAMFKLQRTEVDWNFETKRETRLNKRSIRWPRGKLLGGSSSINAMIYHRCPPSDYDEWEELGNEGWAFKHVEKYFLKAEGFVNAQENGYRPSSYNSLGPLKVSQNPSYFSIIDHFIETSQDVGIPHTPHINDPTSPQIGVLKLPITTDGCLRSSASSCYLPRSLIASRPNLTIGIWSHVSKILFESRKAYGAEILSECGTTFIVKARIEVILSTGSIQSPQILMLSGVGDQEHLKEHHIPLVAHLPGVGKNLLDHIAVFQSYPVIQGQSSDYLLKPLASLFNLFRWKIFGDGPLTSNSAEAAIFFNTKCIRSKSVDLEKTGLEVDPDFEIIGVPAYFDPETPVTYRGEYFSTVTVLLNPKSKGSIELASSNPYHKPLIHANYFANSKDKRILTKALHCENLVSQKMCQRGFLKDPETKKDINYLIKEKSNTLYHPTSTCKMGLSSDPLSVVDKCLKVYGVTGLRIADASIMPTIPKGHTCAPTIMIAEKASDMIISERKSFI